MSNIGDDIPDNWREDPLECTPPVRSKKFLRDRGYEDPDETRVKFLLVGRLRDIVEEKKLRQIDVVERAEVHDKTIGLRQPDVSRILKGNVKGYSIWRLMGEDVRLVTSPAKTDHATVDVVERESALV